MISLRTNFPLKHNPITSLSSHRSLLIFHATRFLNTSPIYFTRPFDYEFTRLVRSLKFNHQKLFSFFTPRSLTLCVFHSLFVTFLLNITTSLQENASKRRPPFCWVNHFVEIRGKISRFFFYWKKNTVWQYNALNCFLFRISRLCTVQKEICFSKWQI